MNLRYANIDECENCNGQGFGVSLFVQGCNFRCKGCFNPETWDFNKGREWNKDVEEYFLNLIKMPYISRLSILGGEPLKQSYQLFLLTQIVKRIRKDIKIWVYSGFTFEEIKNSREKIKFLINTDVLVDGRFEEDKKDLSLPFRGSTNQRIIDVKKSLEKGKVVLYTL